MLAQDALEAIPTFTGKFEDYPGWKKVAQAYSEVRGPAMPTKLNALKNKLGEDAKKIVQGITNLDPLAVDHFFELLDQEYGKEEAIIDSQRQRIFSLAPPKVRYADMRDFLSTVNEVVRTLQHVGHAVWTDRDLRNAVYDKLPPSWRSSYTEAQMRKNKERRLLTLISWMEFKTRALYNSQSLATTAADSKAKDSKPSNETKKPEKKDSTKAFSTTAKGNMFCECCEETTHELAECPKFKRLSKDDRMKLASKTRVHFRCLTHHMGKPCPISRDEPRCPADPDCRHSHHALLHGGKYPYLGRRNDGRCDDRPNHRRYDDSRRDGTTPTRGNYDL
jgi:hypothetical protein